MPMKKVGFIIASSILIFVIVLLTVRGCSISKKSEENVSQKNKSEVVIETNDKNAVKENKSEDGNKISVQSSNNNTSNSEKSKVEEGKKADNENSAEKVEKDNSDSNSKVENKSEDENSVVFKKIESPTLKSDKEISALVSGKESYLADGVSYAYSVNIIIPNEEGKYDIIRYFCPKKTYDAVNSGDTVKVSYQTDDRGIISITSISK